MLMDDLNEQPPVAPVPQKVKIKPGRRSIDPMGATRHVGYRSTGAQKSHLIDVACELGYKNVSDLIRHIVHGWLMTYEKTNGARKAKKQATANTP
jgi:hypothetical protein